MQTLERRHLPEKCSNDAAFLRIKAFAGAMFMINTRTKSFTMLEIFMPLADTVCAGFETGLPLRYINTLSVGDKIVKMRIKENK